MEIEIDVGTFQLRDFRAADISSLAQVANNPKVAAHLRDRFPHPYGEDDARMFIVDVVPSSDDILLAIARGDEVIGSIGLLRQQDVERLSAELGFFVGEAHWGQGIATAAVRALVDHAFANYEFVRIFSHVFEINPASCRVLEKCGFTREATLRRAVIKRGRIMDMHLYALLKDDTSKDDTSKDDKEVGSH